MPGDTPLAKGGKKSKEKEKKMDALIGGALIGAGTSAVVGLFWCLYALFI